MASGDRPLKSSVGAGADVGVIVAAGVVGVGVAAGARPLQAVSTSSRIAQKVSCMTVVCGMDFISTCHSV